MGDCGQYEAGVQARYKRSTTQKEANTEAQIKAFLKSKGTDYNKLMSVTHDSIKELKVTSGEVIAYVGITDYDGKYDSREDTEEFWEAFDNYSKSTWIKLYAVIPVPMSELEHANLNILKEYDTLPTCVDKIIQFESIYKSIYCDSDNTATVKISLPPKVIQDLADGKCTLELYGDGAGNC